MYLAFLGVEDRMNLTFNYFKEEVLRFRELFGNIKSSIENLDKAFKGLSYVYLNVVCENEKEEDSLKNLFVATIKEWEIRRRYLK